MIVIIKRLILSILSLAIIGVIVLYFGTLKSEQIYKYLNKSEIKIQVKTKRAVGNKINPPDTNKPDKINSDYYQIAVDEIIDMLEDKKQLSFKRAVFLVENAYYNGKLNWIE